MLKKFHKITIKHTFKIVFAYSAHRFQAILLLTNILFLPSMSMKSNYKTLFKSISMWGGLIFKSVFKIVKLFIFFESVFNVKNCLLSANRSRYSLIWKICHCFNLVHQRTFFSFPWFSPRPNRTSTKPK